LVEIAIAKFLERGGLSVKSARVFSCLALLTLIVALAGCNKPGEGDSSTNNGGSNPSASPAPGDVSAGSSSNGSASAQAQATPRPPLIVPVGKLVQIRLSQPLSSKESHAGDSFSGSVAESVEVDGRRVIERGAAVHGTVVDAKAMGHFKGGALLQLRLDSLTIHGERRAVETSLWSQTLKGKGKRSAVAIGGGAGLGAALGGIFGGGKGAAIGAAAGAGAGTAGAAFTGNKEIQLPAESTLQFKLKKSIEVP
jgi:hypothetical protein